jgi:hypothetical protein
VRWLAPGLGPVSGIVLAHYAGARPGCVWWGKLVLACFEESGSWWFLAGFSDNVSHILVGAHHGCCSRVVTRGLDRHVLDGVNVWSLTGFGWESFALVRCTGFTDGVLTMGSIPGTAHW